MRDIDIVTLYNIKGVRNACYNFIDLFAEYRRKALRLCGPEQTDLLMEW